MGVVAPGFAHAKYSIVWGEGGVLYFCCELEAYAKFQKPRTTFEIPPLCPVKYSIVWGEWGVPNFF